MVGVLGASLTGCKNSAQNLKASNNSTTVTSNSTEVIETNTVIDAEKPEDFIIDTPVQDVVIEKPSEVCVIETPTDDVVIETPTEDVVIETPTEDVVIETPTEDVVIETPSEFDVTGEDEDHDEEDDEEDDEDDIEVEDPIVEDIKKESTLGFLKRKTLVENPVATRAGAILTAALLGAHHAGYDVIPDEYFSEFLKQIQGLFSAKPAAK